MKKQNFSPRAKFVTKDLMNIQMFQKNNQEGIQREANRQRAFLS